MPTSREVGPGPAHTASAMRRFQSTHLTRGGTPLCKCAGCAIPDFNPPTSREVGLGCQICRSGGAGISIHPPHARWDKATRLAALENGISIHPPHARWDFTSWLTLDLRRIFQSTHLTRGGTRPIEVVILCMGISIHPPHARWDLRKYRLHASKSISIHPPHARWDCRYDKRRSRMSISIHPPHARWDATSFPSTSSMRYFNPPTSREVGLRATAVKPTPASISIHPPHARWDALARINSCHNCRFQSTHLTRGGTYIIPP